MDNAALQKLMWQYLPSTAKGARGQILYSGLDTITRGKFYLLGFNPAKDGTNPLLEDIVVPALNWSAYVHQCWQNGCGERDTRAPARKASCGHHFKPHQTRVQRLAETLNIKLERTFATNAIFVESSDVPGLLSRSDFQCLWSGCWEVHKSLLAKIRPDLILCLGNSLSKNHSTFDIIWRRAMAPRPEIDELGQLKKFRASFDLGNGDRFDCDVVGIRHPSRFSLDHSARNELARYRLQ